MKSVTILHDLSAEDIKHQFLRLEGLMQGLSANFQPKAPEELMTRTEVAKLLKCDLSTIHNWQKKGKLKSYGIGNRVYFKRSEIDAILVPLHKQNESTNNIK